MSSQLFAEDSKYLSIASLISKDARGLDIGCGGGQLGAVLREKNAWWMGLIFLLSG